MANACFNPGFETDLTGWQPAGSGGGIVRSTAEAHSGVASAQFSSTGVIEEAGAYFATTYAVPIGMSLTSRCWLKGSGGTVRVWAATQDGIYRDFVKSSIHTLTSTWTQITAVIPSTTQTAVQVRIEVRTTPAQNISWFVDDAEVIVPDPVSGGYKSLMLTRAG